MPDLDMEDQLGSEVFYPSAEEAALYRAAKKKADEERWNSLTPDEKLREAVRETILEQRETNKQLLYKWLKIIAAIAFALFVLYNWSHPTEDNSGGSTGPCNFSDESGC